MHLAVSAYEQCLNGFAAAFGFTTTREERTVFERPTSDGSQILWLASEQRGETFKVYPGLQLCFPEIRRVVKWLLRDSPFVAMESDEVVLAQPLELTAPIEARERLKFSDAPSALECCERVHSILERWGIPFLDEYATASAWLKGYVRRDARLLLSRQHHLDAVATYLLLGDLARAKEVLYGAYKSPGLRRKYDSAFRRIEVWPNQGSAF